MPTSPIDTTIAFLYAQTNHAARLAHELVVAPQAGAAMARTMATEEVRKEEKKVPTAEKGEKKSQLTTEKDGSQGRSPGRRRMARRQPLPEEPPEEEKASDGGDVLSGNLLNIKV